MGARDVGNNGKPESGAARLAGYEPLKQARPVIGRDSGSVVMDRKGRALPCIGPVSYTHLTLPTILRV